MAQLVVRNLPDDVKARLRRRAKQHGRSLEAEVRDILSSIPEPAEPPSIPEVDIATRLARRQRELSITDGDIDEVKRNIAELRRIWRMRDIVP